MLENIITNPIETPRGYKNPDYGIALRGPLSQFFSALYLKPLDDAFNNMDVTYLRYQDDILILCKTKRQLQRCKHRLIDILQAKRLRLSRKKTRIGSIDQGFHFLGIHYLGTQPLDKTNVTQEHSGPVQRLKSANSLLIVSGWETSTTVTGQDMPLQQPCIVPHARTLRHAREQIKQIVIDGVSHQRIRSYLSRWCAWWVRTVTCWTKDELLDWFLDVCWDGRVASIAAIHLMKQHSQTQNDDPMKRYGLDQVLV